MEDSEKVNKYEKAFREGIKHPLRGVLFSCLGIAVVFLLFTVIDGISLPLAVVISLCGSIIAGPSMFFTTLLVMKFYSLVYESIKSKRES